MRADDGGILLLLVEIGREVDIGGDIPIHVFVSNANCFHFVLAVSFYYSSGSEHC
jgi:hypothetical protein